MEVGKSFMINGIEYKVTLTKPNGRISASYEADVEILDKLNTIVLVENTYYKVLYINSGKKFITLREIKK